MEQLFLPEILFPDREIDNYAEDITAYNICTLPYFGCGDKAYSPNHLDMPIYMLDVM